MVPSFELCHFNLQHAQTERARRGPTFASTRLSAFMHMVRVGERTFFMGRHAGAQPQLSCSRHGSLNTNSILLSKPRSEQS
jgi:hypothetical protein